MIRAYSVAEFDSGLINVNSWLSPNIYFGEDGMRKYQIKRTWVINYD
jgi:hypothetical protein